MKKKSILLNLPEELLLKLKIKAAKEYTTVTALIKKLIKQMEV